jgi:uncharacterized membrane protein YcaP (DUF421 family)
VSVDWEKLFVPTGSVLEVVIRGSVIYLALFLALRFLPRRQVGGIVASDILILVLIADAVQNGMAGEYESITEALVLAGVIIGWATFIDWLDYHFPYFRLAGGAPFALVAHGKLQRRNMARGQVSEFEVMAAMRQHGIDSLERVERMVLEGDGRISVLSRDKHAEDPPGKARR